jgi:hypothetical protein
MLSLKPETTHRWSGWSRFPRLSLAALKGYIGQKNEGLRPFYQRFMNQIVLAREPSSEVKMAHCFVSVFQSLNLLGFPLNPEKYVSVAQER